MDRLRPIRKQPSSLPCPSLTAAAMVSP
jgi:hypothetical protein